MILMIFHQLKSCELGSMHGLWVPVIRKPQRPATPKQVCRFGHPQWLTLRDVVAKQTTHLWEGAKQGLSRASAHTATLCRHAPHRRSTNADLGSGRGRPFRGPSGPHFPNIK
jgi:hypothetical protein